MNYLDYRKKLGIGFNNSELERLFLNKVRNHLKVICSNSTYDYVVTPQMVFEYANTIGADFENMDTTYCLDSIIEDFIDEDNICEFLAKYAVFLFLIKGNKHAYSFFNKMLHDYLSESQIPYEIIEDKDGSFVFPKGAKELDDALVSEPLQWLSKYPQTRKEWIDSLKDYSNLTDANASDIADKFRKALERFFQEFFNSSKSLENLKSEYGTYMKAKGVPSEVSNNLEVLLQSYTNFMNGYAKHHDKTSKNILEYVMYQTGNIIRLLITLEKGA